MLNQSFKKYFIATSGNLLPSGTTTDLAVGQIGIFDANTYQATLAPTYANNKAILIAQGTPDNSDMPAGAGIANETNKSKPIAGKKLKSIRVKKSRRGQNGIVTVGFDGIDTTKTLSAGLEETKYLYITLTGAPIEKLVPGGRHVVKLIVTTPCASDCDDNCGTIDCNFLADSFIEHFNQQKLPGGIPLKKYVKINKLTGCDIDPSGIVTVDYTFFCLEICDNGDAASLGAVQSQFPGVKITRTKRTGSISTYQLAQLTSDPAPDAFSNEALTILTDCGVCPSGYTSVDSVFAFKVTRSDDGTAANLTTIKADYNDDGTLGASTTRLQYENGTSTYLVYSFTNPNTFSLVDGDIFSLVGEKRAVCILDTPSETEWSECGTGVKVEKSFVIDLKDTICGESRLTELQALYSSLGTVEEVSQNVATCVRKYKLTILSDNIVTESCDLTDPALFTNPPAFDGATWTVDTADITGGTDCVCGLAFESGFVARRTQECTFDAFPYEADPIHIQVSQTDPSYNSTKICETDWPITYLRDVQLPSGSGEYISRLEMQDKGYQLQDFSHDAAVRLAERYYFLTQIDAFYDEYAVDFDYEYPVGGFSNEYTDRYSVHVFFPEGQGGQFETALNTYASSQNINIDLVIS